MRSTCVPEWLIGSPSSVSDRAGSWSRCRPGIPSPHAMCDAALVEQRVVEDDTGRPRAAGTVHASLNVYPFELGDER